ncbi:MAG: RNA 2',3'-cyclic phosphodiesterase [Verrucomicrobiota bacterium]|jgi:RNA 2',3'-cyclic 3'-phosphodiesterase
MTGEGSTERFRLFVAISVPDAVRNEIVCVQRELQRFTSRDTVRWTKPEQFHLTLRFLGDVSSDRLAALQESLRVVCSGAPPLHLRAQGIGFFPDARSPRVVWVGINDDGNRLAGLQKKIEVAVQSFVAKPGGEHFAGHVTLGRFKLFNNFEIKALTNTVEAMKNRTLGKWTATEVEVVRSELSRIGTVYRVLTTLFLGGKIKPS